MATNAAKENWLHETMQAFEGRCTACGWQTPARENFKRAASRRAWGRVVGGLSRGCIREIPELLAVHSFLDCFMFWRVVAPCIQGVRGPTFRCY